MPGHLDLTVTHALVSSEHERGKRALTLRCGPTILAPGGAGLPEHVTGWESLVTCTACLLAQAIARPER